MKVRLRGLSTFCRYMGEEHHVVELPEKADLPQLMEWVHERWGDMLPPHLWNATTRRPTPSVMIMVDGRRAEDPIAPLAEGQEVLLVNMVVGG